MSSSDRDDSPAADLHARLLAALLDAADDKSGDIVLLAHGPHVSLLLAAHSAQRMYVFAMDGDDAPARLGEALLPLVKQSNRQGIETHFIFAGGGEPVRAAVKMAIPRLQSGVMGFHHIDEFGHVEKLGRAKLPLLQAAAERVGHIAPLGPEGLQKAIAMGEALVRAEQDATSKLRGRFAVTAALTAACVVLTGLGYLWGKGDLDAVLYQMGANSGSAVQKDGELFRLLASAFLHADIIHLVVNMFALWVFGTLLEALLGGKRYLLLYALSALGGSIASAFARPDGLSVGASGAIWGLMAGGIGVAFRARGLLPPTMAAQMRQRAWAPLVINVLYSFQPGIDMLAHIGGGVVGFLLTTFVLTRGLKPVEARSDPADAEASARGATLGGAAVAALAMALSVAMALAAGRPWEYGAPPTFVRTPLGATGLSVELPSAVTRETTAEEPEPGVWVLSYGKPPHSPVVFEAIVGTLSGEVPAEQLDAFLDAKRETAEANPPPKFKLKGRAQRVTAGPRPAIYVEYTLERLLLKTYFIVVGDREIILRGYAREERASGWDDVEARAAASIAKE